MSVEKSLIRRQVLAYRRLLSAEELTTRNEKVIALAVDFITANSIGCLHTFLPITKNAEVDTWPLITQCADQDKTVVISATDFQTQTMSHFYYSEDLEFRKDRFDIPTPVNGALADLANVDLVFVPLLAADHQGNRIGYGKGYYDRLLPEMRTDVIKVGLNLCPLFDEFPFAESHDVQLDYCILPSGVVKF